MSAPWLLRVAEVPVMQDMDVDNYDGSLPVYMSIDQRTHMCTRLCTVTRFSRAQQKKRKSQTVGHFSQNCLYLCLTLYNDIITSNGLRFSEPKKPSMLPFAKVVVMAVSWMLFYMYGVSRVAVGMRTSLLRP